MSDCKMLVRLCVAVAALTLVAPVGQAVTIEMVTVGNPGNADDTTGYGGVDYVYKIGKYEVTAGQYTEFLNAVASTDDYGLYDPIMSSLYSGCKIERHGDPGSYTYTVATDRANRPANGMTFWGVARFVNWLNNGQGNGDTETGSYINIGDAATFARQPGAKYFIPNEDEWYKAAYHKNDGVTGNYFDYPTSSDSVPSNVLVDPDPGNHANYAVPINHYTVGSPYYTTVVGEFENSQSPYGTYDQAGNIWEWTETAGSGSSRIARGGGWYDSENYMRASTNIQRDPGNPNTQIGFRVAYIPEPASITIFVYGLLTGWAWRKCCR